MMNTQPLPEIEAMTSIGATNIMFEVARVLHEIEEGGRKIDAETVGWLEGSTDLYDKELGISYDKPSANLGLYEQMPDLNAIVSSWYADNPEPDPETEGRVLLDGEATEARSTFTQGYVELRTARAKTTFIEDYIGQWEDNTSIASLHSIRRPKFPDYPEAS